MSAAIGKHARPCYGSPVLSSRKTGLLGLALALASACGGAADLPEGGVRRSIGADGGSITSSDGRFTIFILPGALGKHSDFEIVPTEAAPDSFGPAYRVRPNIELGFDAQIAYRGDLPEQTGDTAIAAIYADASEEDWAPLPVDVLHDDPALIQTHDDRIALYYALIDGGEPGDTTTTGDPTTSGSDTMLPVLSHAADIQPIWDARCGGDGCHTPGELPLGGGLDLSGNAYGAIVDMPAVGANRPLVDAGSADGSYMYNKLDGSFLEVGGGGSPMPLAMPALDAGTLATVRDWIDQGAPP